jgi:predicted RNA-binding Zn ribbon-like protein
VPVTEEFVLVGGRPCLDLVATLGKRRTDPIERIPDPGTLGRWFVASGLLSAAPAVDGHDLVRARRLREAIHVLVRGAPADAEAVAILNAEAGRVDLAPQLAVDADGHLAAARSEGSAEAALTTVARDAVRLLGSPAAARVKECEHPDCSLVFLDDTQSGRRRWCSMDRCGNLVKVAAYRSRRSRTADDLIVGAEAADPRADSPARSARSRTT